MPHPGSLDGLVALSHQQGVDIRPSLIRVLTDLHVQQRTHTREEGQRYIELALRLLPLVDVPTRMAVASKLAAYPHAPASVLSLLAADVAEVADLVAPRMMAPPATSGRGVARIAAKAASSAWPGFAPAAPPQPTAVVDAAPQSDVGDAFLQADSAGRRALLDRPASLPAATVLPAAPGLVDRLEAAALQRSPQDFRQELQHGLGLSATLASRIADDDGGEPILVIARALAMPPAVLVRILLLLNPAIGESVERVFALTRLYDEVATEAALRIVASWRGAQARTAAKRFQPLHASDDERALAAADNARRSTRAQTAQPQRSPGAVRSTFNR
jgi:hypothetical protein